MKRHGKYNGPWHGNNNYVKTFKYLYYTALGLTTERNKVYKSKSNSVINGLKRVYKEKDNKVDANCEVAKQIKAIAQKATKENARLFIFGMSLHVVGDVYAHRTKIKVDNKFVKPRHYDVNKIPNYCYNTNSQKFVPDCDCKTHITKRFTAAKQAVKKAFTYFAAKETKGLKYVYYVDALDGSQYKIANFKKLVGKPVSMSKKVSLSGDKYNLLGQTASKGINEGRTASPLFSPTFYMESYDDVEEYCNGNNAKAYEHFVWNGLNEGRYASQDFRLVDYMNYNQDLKSAFENNYLSYYVHYAWKGWMEQRICTTDNE